MSEKTFRYITGTTSIMATSGAVGAIAGAVTASMPVIVASGIAMGGAALLNAFARPPRKQENPKPANEPTPEKLSLNK